MNEGKRKEREKGESGGRGGNFVAIGRKVLKKYVLFAILYN